MLGTLILLSGGQDSTTAALWALHNLEAPYLALGFEYGQRHEVELDQAHDIAIELEIPFQTIDIQGVFDQLTNILKLSALRNSHLDISAPSFYDPSLPASFVPGRNILFLAVGSIYAAMHDFSDIVAGMCQEDYSGYPDCRDTFLTPMGVAMQQGLNKQLRYHFPILNLSKAETFQLAFNLGRIDLILEKTHTCYNGNREKINAWGYGCGQCPACQVRARGFEAYCAAQPSQEA